MSRPKFYSLYDVATASDGTKHYVTVVAKFEVEKIKVSVAEELPNGLLLTDKKVRERKVTLASSICDPRDTFDKERGIELAKSRIERGETIGSLRSSEITMLNEDQIMLLLLAEVNHICKHIDKYIKL